MAFQSAPDCAEAVISALLGGSLINNVLNFHKPGGYDEDDLQALADVVDSHVGSDWLPALSTGYGYLGTLVRGLQDPIDLSALANAEAGVGGVASASVPANACLVVTHRTGHTGRSARGRTYISGLPVSKLGSATVFTSDVKTTWESIFEALRTAAVAEGWLFVVLSRQTSGSVRTFAEPFTITESEVRDTTIDSQRGRTGN